MNSNQCNAMLEGLSYQWSEDNGKKRGFCLLKGCPCEGPSCMAWAPIVSFCRSLCPKRADCRSRMSDLVGTLDRPASDFDCFGFCLVRLGEVLQKRRSRRACLRVRPDSLGRRRGRVRHGS